MPYKSNTKKHTKEELFELFEKLGPCNVERAYRLGLYYLNYKFKTINEARSQYWLRRAAENGHVKACLVLGRIYSKHHNEHYQKMGRYYYKQAIKLDMQHGNIFNINKDYELLKKILGE